MLRFIQTALVLMVAYQQTVLAQTDTTTFRSQARDRHNFQRAKHCNTPPVALDDAVTSAAQTCANNNAASNASNACGQSTYGELRFSTSSSVAPITANGAAAVDAFYNGISNYPWSAPGFTSSSGGFSQIVWKASTKIGVGVAIGNNGKTAFITMFYSPRGNVNGQFAANVEPANCSGPTTTAAPTTTVAPSVAQARFQNEGLAHHNALRDKHCTGPMTLSGHLNTIAQQYADYLAANNLFQHGPNAANYGENLWMMSSSAAFPTNYAVNGSVPTQAWYDEIAYYNFDTLASTGVTGHFTQVIWAASTEVGFGVAFSADRKKVYGVANYNPPGNFNMPSTLPANVKKPKPYCS